MSLRKPVAWLVQGLIQRSVIIPGFNQKGFVLGVKRLWLEIQSLNTLSKEVVKRHPGFFVSEIHKGLPHGIKFN